MKKGTVMALGVLTWGTRETETHLYMEDTRAGACSLPLGPQRGQFIHIE